MHFLQDVSCYSDFLSILFFKKIKLPKSNILQALKFMCFINALTMNFQSDVLEIIK